MTDRHIFNEDGLVLRSLKGLVATHPGLSLIPAHKIVLRADHDSSKVALISGGGAGHEPGVSGFVGRGLLSAGVSGDIFASPSARQVLEAIFAVPSSKGTVLIVTNYTGDTLHFGLACQKAKANGVENVGIILVTDDVSVGQKPGAQMGRRALSGITLVSKILGAAAERDFTFSGVMALGKALTDHLVSIAATLDHCHVPGRIDHSRVAEDTIELGTGLHNEPGYILLSPRPSGSDLIGKMLSLMLDQKDPERSFVQFRKTDAIVLFVGNMGGISPLELGVVVDETLEQLDKDGIAPVRVFSGSFMTTLNALGFSLSLLNLTNVAKDTEHNVDELLQLLDAPHKTVGWPGNHIASDLSESLRRRSRRQQWNDAIERPTPTAEHVTLKLDSTRLTTFVRQAAEAVSNAEPDLTRWDTSIGDGDCGQTCKQGAKAVLDALDHGLGSDGDVVRLLRTVTDLTEGSMGGTLSAILGILLNALFDEVCKATKAGRDLATAKSWGQVLLAAIATLQQSTRAREGDRTMMDALIPFAQTLESTDDLGQAITACDKGAKATAEMTPRFGRATYVSDTHGVPDPGAMAIAILTSSWRL